MRERIITKFYDEVRRGNLKVDKVSGLITRTNMGEVVRKYLAERKRCAGPRGDSP